MIKTPDNASPRAGWTLGTTLIAVFASLAGCSSAEKAPDETVATTSNLQDRPADEPKTALQDSNYAAPDQLAARKRALATMSAEDAKPEAAGTVEPGAADPYTRSEYPDVFARWGKAVPLINRERHIAAQIAANDARCDGVVNFQITDGGTRADRHYMGECNNLTRIYFDKKSLANHRSAIVRTAADMGAAGVLDW